jgi:uncharacterized protein involved in outer membrane biogenesis
MSPFRIIAGIAALLLVVLLIMGLYLQFADINRHKPRIEAMVSNSTGREFRLGGDLELSIWPMLTLEVGDLGLANAPWSEEPQMVRIGHLLVQVYPFSLLSGPIRVKALKIHDVEVLAETDAGGVSNWTLDSDSGSGKSASGDGLPVLLENAELKDILVIVRRVGEEDRRMRLDELLIQPGEENMELAGTGEFFSRPLQLAGTLGPIDQFRSQGEVELNLWGNLGKLDLQLIGRVANLKTLEGTRLDLQIDTEDIAPLLESAGLPIPVTGPLHIEADLQQQGAARLITAITRVSGISTNTWIDLSSERIELKQNVSSLRAVGNLLEVADLPDLPLELRMSMTPRKDHIEVHELIASMGEAKLNASGQLAADGGSSSLKLQLEGASLAELGQAMPDIPFKASADASYAGRTLELDFLDLTLGKSDLSGQVLITRGDKSKLVAKLHSTLIDLTDLFPDTADGQVKAAATPASNHDYVFKDEPLPFELLQALDAEIAWTIDELSRGEMRLRPVVMAGQVHKGILTATATASGEHGGEARGQLELATTNQSADLTATFAARVLRLNFASGDAEPGQIPPNDITVSLSSRGGSPDELASAANGSMLLTQGPGKINNTLVSKMSADILSELLSSLNPLAKTEEFSNWQCSLAFFKITQGKATLEQLILQGEKVMVVGGGKIDLASEQLNLEFNTKPRKGIGVSADMFLTPFVALKGTLISPALGLNEKGTLLTAGAAAATGGLSLLLKAAIDRLGGSVDHCIETLPDYPHPPYAQ